MDNSMAREQKFKKMAYTGPSDTAHPIQYMCRNLHEEENQLLTHHLKEKIRLLRSLSLDIGAEVRYQTRVLHQLDDDFDKADSFLIKAVNRVTKLTKGAHYYYFVFIFLFSFVCLSLIWCIIRFR